MEKEELEVKFHVSSLEKMENRLVKQGAQLVFPHTDELNVRLDTPDERLARSGQVLRLRQDQKITVTYKGKSKELNGVRVRSEIEFRVDDYEATLSVFEALGYAIVLVYEKKRSEYLWKGLHISLDLMPYGEFMEIEGEDTHTIIDAAKELNLDWTKRIPDSYIGIYNSIKKIDHLQFRDITFENLKTWHGSLSRVGIFPADLSTSS